MSSLLPECAGQNYVTWRDVLCLTPLKAGLLVAVRQLFSFVAVAASEIVTVISSNSSFISFWRFFRGIFWEVLWTLKLTQSQVGIVELKIVNSLNRYIKRRNRNRLLVTFVVYFTALWTFWHFNSALLKNLYTLRTNIVSRSYRIIKGLVPTVIRIWSCFGQRSRFFARF